MSINELPCFESLLNLADKGGGVWGFTPALFMSNARPEKPPESSSPHGGYLAAHCLMAAQAALASDAQSIRALTVQFMSSPVFAPLDVRPRVLRRGRSAAFVDVAMTQDGKAMLAALATFGSVDDEVQHRPNDAPDVEPPESLAKTSEAGHMPRHARFDERFPCKGGTVLGKGEEAVLRLWRRFVDRKPMTAERLIYLIDAMAPPLHAVTDRVHRTASIDLRYDFIAPIEPDDTRDGWALFEYRARDWSGGWTIDEVTVWNRAGRVLALGRQQRKMLGERPT